MAFRNLIFGAGMRVTARGVDLFGQPNDGSDGAILPLQQPETLQAKQIDTDVWFDEAETGSVSSDSFQNSDVFWTSNDEVGYLECFFDESFAEEPTEAMMDFVESAPVVADAPPNPASDAHVVIALYEDPELEEFEWTPYQPNAPPENQFEEYYEWWDDDLSADDWQVIIDDDDDAINMDVSIPADDSRDWSWDEDSAADDWQVIIDDDDDAVNPDASPYPVADDYDWIFEEPDEDPRVAIDDPVGANASPYPVEDAWDWSADEPDEDERVALGSDPVGSNAIVVLFSVVEDSWDWVIDEPDEDDRLAVSDPVGADAPQLFGDDAEQADEDFSFVGISPSEYQQSDNPAPSIEDAFDWSAEEPEDDLRVSIDADPVGANNDSPVEDAFDWSAEEPEDDLRISFDADPVCADAQPYPVEDAWDWSQEDPEADAWEVLVESGSDALFIIFTPNSIEDAWDWSAEEPDEDERAWLETEITTFTDLWQSFGNDAEQADEDLSQTLIGDGYIQTDIFPSLPPDDSFDASQEDLDADAWQLITDAGNAPVGIDAQPVIVADDFIDWSQDEADDDLRIFLEDTEVSADASAPIQTDDVYSFDEDGYLSVEPAGYQQSDNPAPGNEDGWDWSAEEPEDDLRTFLGGDPVGSDSNPLSPVEEREDHWSQDADDETFVVLDVDPVGSDAPPLAISDEWDWSAEEPDEDYRPALDDPPPPDTFAQTGNDEWLGWYDDPEDELWTYFGEDWIASPDVVLFDDSAEWWLDEVDEDAVLDTQLILIDAPPLAISDEWDWSSEEPDEDERASLDADPVGADAQPMGVEDEWLWTEEVDDDWFESASISDDGAPLPADEYDWWSVEFDEVIADDPIGANAQPYPVEDVWDWSAEEPEDDLRIALDASLVGVNAAVPPFSDGEWPWQADGEDDDWQPPEPVTAAETRAIEDAWDWSSADADDEIFVDADARAIVAAPPEDAWPWQDDVENEFDFDQNAPQPPATRAHDDDLAVFFEDVADSIDWYQDEVYSFLRFVQYFEDPADFWTQDSDDDIPQVMDLEPVGLDAHTYPKYEDFDWYSDDTEFDDGGFITALDYAPTGGLTARWLVYAAAVRALLIEPSDIRHLMVIPAAPRLISVAAPAPRLLVVNPSGPRHLAVSGIGFD